MDAGMRDILFAVDGNSARAQWLPGRFTSQPAINGFGRIGRSILRLAAKSDDFDSVLINDVASLQTSAYLFEFDSIFGPWQGQVGIEEQRLTVDGRGIPFHSEYDVGALDLSDIDVVLECTGHSAAVSFSRSAPAAGARRVLISGAASGADLRRRSTSLSDSCVGSATPNRSEAAINENASSRAREELAPSGMRAIAASQG